MATYPVVNTKTGEQKEVVMSIMEWDKWKRTIPIGQGITQIHPQFQAWEKLESGKINSPTNIQVGSEILKKSEKLSWNKGSFSQ